MTKTEAVARAICRACGHDPDTVMAINLGAASSVDVLSRPLWTNFQQAACSAIEALSEVEDFQIVAFRRALEPYSMGDGLCDLPDHILRECCEAVIREAAKP